MSEGRCGAHEYGGIDRSRIEAIISALEENGSDVTGSNPWDVDTNNNGVVLRGTWNEAASTLTVIVTEKRMYVPCSAIWDAIDPLIKA